MARQNCTSSGTIAVWTKTTIATYAHLGELPSHVGDYECDGCGLTGPGTRLVTQDGRLRAHEPGKLPR